MTHYLRQRSYWVGFVVAVSLAGTAVAAAVPSSRPTSTARPVATRLGIAQHRAQAGTEAARTSNARAGLAVFHRARATSDVLAGYALAQAQGLTQGEALAAPDTQLGTLGINQSRLLLADQGSDDVDLYAFPDSKGQVCVVYSAIYGTDGCFGTFTPSVPVSFSVTDPDQVGGGYPAIVAGLAPLSVVSVDVVTGGVQHAATLSNGAYFYELGKTEPYPEGVVAHYRDGSSATVGIPATPVITNANVG